MKTLIYTFLTLLFLLSNSNAINVGDPAPDFTLQSLDDGEISLSDYHGKVVYLFFLGNGCPPCESHAPQIENDIYNHYSRDDVQVLGIDIWSGGSTNLNNFKNITKVTFPLLNSGVEIATNLYDIYLQDHTVIVDQEGNVAYTHSNYPSDLKINDSKDIIDNLLSVTGIRNVNVSPNEFELKPNYPNPFNPTTNIPFTVDKNQNIKLEIYNITGRLVKTLINASYPEGSYNVVWDALDDHNYHVASGIYFIRLSGEQTTQTRQIILLK